MNLVSWKSIELQVALPRVQEAGKEQDLMSKQNQRFQETLTQSQLHEEIQKRKQVNKFEHLQKSKLADQDEGREKHEEKKRQRRETEKIEEDIKHPYLGSNIDFSG